MPNDALAKVHGWLLEQGFVRLTAETRTYAYEGVLQCNQLEVPVRLSFDNLDLIDLPVVTLVEPRPQSLRKPLPHIDRNGTVCYLDHDSNVLDRYSPVTSFATLLSQVKSVLTDSLSGRNSEDVGYEFTNYWENSGRGVVLDSPDSNHCSQYQWMTYTGLKGEERLQLLIGTTDTFRSYAEWRGGQTIASLSGTAVWIQLGQQLSLPVRGDWPPKNAFEFYRWLESFDPKAAKRLSFALGTKPCAQNPLLIILKSPTVMVGAEIRLPKSLQTSTQDPSRFRKQVLADKGQFGTVFNRVTIDDLRSDFLTTRNLVDQSLGGKRIALVGCGTIGGHLARLLVQAGAGSKSGKLILYDCQNLSPGNLGRHYLDGRYLFENKAEACEHKLRSEFPQHEIKAIPRNFSHLEGTRADLLIDSTGYEVWSTTLNDQFLRAQSESKAISPVLYVWVDGNGHCGRTLHVDGTGACYRCLRSKDGLDRFAPLVKEMNQTPMSYQCGESYIPFPPSASIQAAAMGLEAALDWVAGNPSPRFRTRAFSSFAREHRNQNLDPLSECPACRP